MARTWSMDSTDMKILSILQDDSRKSFVELAEELGLSETAVRNRVSKLIEKGVIKRFTIQLELDKIGKPISSIICVRIGGEIGPIAASGLMDIEAITEIYTVTGEYDLILKILCKSIEDLERV